MKIFIGAGEASGDRIAAQILKGLRERHPALTVYGFGGPLCAAEGLKSSYSLAELAVNGVGDVLRRGVFLLRARAALLRELTNVKPDLVLLVDYPGMNVALAQRARALGLRVLYVAPPQLWAYKNAARRLARLRRALAGVPLQVLLPFEAASYAAWGAPVTQGHFFPCPAFEAARGTRLLLCPGSRRGVLRRNLPLWLARVRDFFGTLEGVDILVPNYLADEARTICAEKTPAVITDRAAAFAHAGAAIAFPGTITLELFLHQIPTRVWGVLDPLTLWAGRRALRGPHVALPNVMAHRAGLPAVFPEWIGTAADFRRAQPVIPESRADWSPAATTQSLHTVWLSMGSDQGVETALATLT
jgi:lipid-A-disaccharide synthase